MEHWVRYFPWEFFWSRLFAKEDLLFDRPRNQMHRWQHCHFSGNRPRLRMPRTLETAITQILPYFFSNTSPPAWDFMRLGSFQIVFASVYFIFHNIGSTTSQNKVMQHAWCHSLHHRFHPHYHHHHHHHHHHRHHIHEDSLKVEVPRGFDPFRERPSVAVQANTGLRKNLVMMVSMVVMMVVSMMVVFMMVKNMIWKWWEIWIWLWTEAMMTRSVHWESRT